MNRARFGAVALPVAFGLAACSTMSLTTDYDRNTDFSKYATFEFIPAKEIKNPLIRERVENAIAKQLETKGLKAASGSADLLVAAHGRLDSQTQIDYTSFGYGWGGWGGYWGGYGGMGTTTATAREIPVGTLIIDLVDGQTKKLVWQAVASDTLDPSATPEEREYNINAKMKKIFAGYPPQAK